MPEDRILNRANSVSSIIAVIIALLTWFGITGGFNKQIFEKRDERGGFTGATSPIATVETSKPSPKPEERGLSPNQRSLPVPLPPHKEPEGAGALQQTTYESACRSGAAESCFELGRMYSEGTSIPSNPTLEIKYFALACDEKYLPACSFAARALGKEADKTRGDPAEAISYAEKGCKGNDGRSCYEAGLLYMNTKNYYDESARAKIKRYLPAACSALIYESCYQMGEFDTSWMQNSAYNEEAYNYYRSGCNGDVGLSCFRAAEEMENNRGARKDIPEELKYLQKACDLKVQRGCDSRRYLAQNSFF